MGISRVSSLLAVFLILAPHFVFSMAAAVDFSGDHELLFVPTTSDFFDDNDDFGFGMEFQMDSEINRRILATTRYISYGALRRNNVPCSRRGASYYNCRPGAQANPYTRGCSAITRCRS
ncbi:protein RALF-like 33 [Cucumis sativus]|uniref:Uncharacterized protein n=1 Tax=Cucumis sativus TaxID=3659 RepID=A0A0A0KBU7_CUCSA|nr:protein RALF-like 33 [Cucumis sativus]KGN47180.1 hypothetical protein Csa_020637 [Cucumis sativus]